ncbi:hypothetical protein ACTHAM_002901 [Cellulomonas soli]|uniref:hypothetical protein n=1 Tax=Cellulomonas soli TaxID=931535 RepID=UPI003F857C3E
MPGDLPPVFTGPAVYHYTDAAGLIGMVQDRVLWATESSGMNDPREGEYGLDALRRHQPPEGDREDFGSHLEAMESVAGDPVYVACACTREDDVSQWVRYTPWPDVGYSVGLDATVQLGVVRTGPPRDTEGTRSPGRTVRLSEVAYTTRWSRVLYGQENIDKVLAEFPSWAQGYVADAGVGVEEEYDYEAERQAAEARVITALLEIGRLAKDGGFAAESEVRVVARSLWGEDFVQYRASRYGVVRYVELGAVPRTSGFVVRAKNDPPATPLPIVSVMIGPSPYAERGKESVRQLLRKNGLDIEPTISASQVR